MMYLYKIIRDNPKKPIYDLLFKSIKSEEVKEKREELISKGLDPLDILVSNLDNWIKINRNTKKDLEDDNETI